MPFPEVPRHPLRLHRGDVTSQRALPEQASEPVPARVLQQELPVSQGPEAAWGPPAA